MLNHACAFMLGIAAAAVATAGGAHDRVPGSSATCEGMLSARAHGAVGDGRTDDAPALQQAIDAAQRDNKTLWLPAGLYLVNSSLLVQPFRHDVRNSEFKPLRLLGEGEFSTTIVAGRPLDAVLDFLPQLKDDTPVYVCTTFCRSLRCMGTL